jgi:hypothetical protein
MVTQVDYAQALLERALRLVQESNMTLQQAAQAIIEEMSAEAAAELWRRYGAEVLYRLLLQHCYERRRATYQLPRTQPERREEWVRERADLILSLPVAYLDERGHRRLIIFGDATAREVRGAVVSHLDYSERHRQQAQRFERFLPYLSSGRRVRELPPELVVALWTGEGS